MRQNRKLNFNYKKLQNMKLQRIIVFVAIFSLLSSGLVLPVEAARLTVVKDTLSDSDVSVAATHALAWTSANAVVASSSIAISWDAAFTGGAGLDYADLTGDAGLTPVASCGVAANEVLVTGSATGVSLEVCEGDSVAAGAHTLSIVGLTNPSSTGSQAINILSGSDTGRAMVAIIDDVVMTAAVGASFTFTVSAKNDGTVGDSAGDSCDDNTATATSLPFGDLVADTAEIICQSLSVSTNAKNGFVVTVIQDQRLLSATGGDIDTFKDDGQTATPEVWAAPSATLDTETTYGHMGLTSSDDLNGNEFVDGTEYVGNLLAARQVFSHTGPANGSTADKGAANVGYKIEVDQLQEAGDDYTATLTYVATPTF